MKTYKVTSYYAMKLLSKNIYYNSIFSIRYTEFCIESLWFGFCYRFIIKLLVAIPVKNTMCTTNPKEM